jgi:hypothetical protein
MNYVNERFIYFCAYAQYLGDLEWLGVGEVPVGLGEAHSVICRHGRGLDGFSASVDGCGATHIIHGSVLDFHGFQDGGGHTHTTMGTGFHGVSMER